MASRAVHLADFIWKSIVSISILMVLATASVADLSSSESKKSEVTNLTLQTLTNFYTTCLLDAIQKEEIESRLNVVSTANLKTRCQKERHLLELKTSKSATAKFEAQYVNHYYLAKAGKLTNAAIPKDKIIDLK